MPSWTLSHKVRAAETRLRAGQLDGVLFRHVDALQSSVRETPTTKDVLRSRILLAETEDHRGRTKSAQQAVREGPELWAQIQSLSEVKQDEREFRRDQVRFIADYARVFYYREQRYLAAKHLLFDCLKFVRERLVDEHCDKPFLCHGTQARLNYYLGCACRQLGEYDEANKRYGFSIDSFRDWATVYGPAGEVRARWRAALCSGLGLGWVNYTRGRLTEALNNLRQAQAFLLGINDPISEAYLSLVRGSIERCLAGSDTEKLRAAMNHVERADRTFSNGEYAHDSYGARAAYELALGHLYSGNLEGAEQSIAKTEDVSKRLTDLRWECNVWVVRSRIRRRRGDARGALEAADRAYVLAADLDESLGRIDALIARGEASLDLKMTESAREAFESARAEVARRGTGRSGEVSNPKIDAVISIHVARSHVVDGNSSSAREALGRWHALANLIEHEAIRKMARDVEEELCKMQDDFRVNHAVGDLTYTKHEADLRRWLIMRARRETRKKGSVTDKLGISRQTLYQWERKLGLLE